METWKDLFPEDIQQRYELLNYNHAAEIISQAFQKEFDEIIETLRKVKITKTDIAKSGGNESPIPPKFSAIFRPVGVARNPHLGRPGGSFLPKAGR